MIYLTLFSVALLSATLLPMGSEALLLYDASLGYSLLTLWLVASAGNTLGSLVNYIVGLKGEEYLEAKGHLSSEKMAKAHGYFERYGAAVLLLSWVPIIGDPLTFAGGVLRYDLRRFIVIVFAAKSIRYAVLLALYQSAGVPQ